MAPPGRRKLHLLMLLCSALFLFTSVVSAAPAVLGIDLGTEYLKAAIAKPGSPIEVVLTKDSKRKEAAAIAFKPSRAQNNDPEAFPERLYGGDALALSARFPGDVYYNVKSLLGLARYSDPVKEYIARYPGLQLESISRFIDGNTRGTVGFRSQTFGDKKEIFMVEELLAMELRNIKANAEAAMPKGSVVTDVVITYPAYYTTEEKRAVELAADLAGLRVLSMVSDGLAVGLNYATGRTFDSITDGAEPEHHLVYDMGAGSTTATILKFQGRTVKDVGKRNKTIQEVQVLGTGFDRTLGGDSFNDVIVKDMINQLVESTRMKTIGVEPVHVQRHAKTMARFWKEAERLRQVLSANSQSSTSLEGVYYDDVTFKYTLTRDHFEKLMRGHAARVSAPLTQALNTAGITLGAIDSVILHGGAVRTPFVQKQLEAIAGGSSKIKTNVNADEAAVLGAAFKAASQSISFRVKDIRGIDISGSAYNVKWTADGKEKQQKMFTSTSQLGVEKQVPIKVLEDVSFGFSQLVNDKEVPMTTFDATNLTKSAKELQDRGCAPINITTTFSMRLSPVDGLPEVVSGSVSCKLDSVKEGGVLDNVKGLFGFGSKKDASQEPLVEDEDSAEVDSTTLTPLPVSDPTSSGTTVSQTSVSASSSDEAFTANSHSSSTKTAKSTKPTSSLVTIPLALKASAVGLNAPPSSSLPRIRERLGLFDSSDRNTVLRSEALNMLESFTYGARDYLTDESFMAVSDDQLRKKLGQSLSDASEWLYGEGTDAKLQDFQAKLKGLKSIVDPVLKRKEEASGRDAALKGLQDGLENMSGMMQMVEGSMKRVAEDAASSLSSAASSVVESITSSTPSHATEGDSLEDDPYSTSSDPATAGETESPLPKPYEYTAEDLSSMTKMYDSVKSWLDEKLAAQEKLSPYEDPVMLVSELQVRAKQLQSSVSDVIMKSIKMQDVPRPKKKSSSKKAKSKKSKGSSSPTNKTVSATETTETTVTTSIRDEL